MSWFWSAVLHCGHVITGEARNQLEGEKKIGERYVCPQDGETWIARYDGQNWRMT